MRVRMPDVDHETSLRHEPVGRGVHLSILVEMDFSLVKAARAAASRLRLGRHTSGNALAEREVWRFGSTPRNQNAKVLPAR